MATNSGILTRPYSDNPDDSYLSIILHKNWKGEWVTHMVNHDDGGYYNGHYFGDDLKKATEDFHSR